MQITMFKFNNIETTKNKIRQTNLIKGGALICREVTQSSCFLVKGAIKDRFCICCLSGKVKGAGNR